MKLWLAKQNYGGVGLYVTKPYRRGEYWITTGNYYLFDRHLFPELTIENSPQQVEIKLVEK